MNLVAAELLASLGMGGMALDIKPDEIGMSLTFTKSMAAHSGADDADTLAEQLLTSLRKLSGLPSKLSSMLKAESTTAEVDATRQTGLVRMKRPTDYALKPGAEEDYASALHHAAGRKQVSVDGGEYGTHFAEDVAVAIPRRVPTELDRHHILRLEMLGEGNFGEVSVQMGARRVDIVVILMWILLLPVYMYLHLYGLRKLTKNLGGGTYVLVSRCTKRRTPPRDTVLPSTWLSRPSRRLTPRPGPDCSKRRR
jgi:hypothetical protein